MTANEMSASRKLVDDLLGQMATVSLLSTQLDDAKGQLQNALGKVLNDPELCEILRTRGIVTLDKKFLTLDGNEINLSPVVPVNVWEI